MAHGWFWAVLRRWSAKSESEFPNLPSCSFLRICATALFFRVTEMVKGSMRQLVAVEATQSMEVLFATAGEVIWLSASLPTPLVGGALLIMLGMVLHSVSGRKEKEASPVNVSG
ncbi:multidrug resistance efflux transporter family protein [Brevibacillus laterosporus]|uniref:multidrug resistance efflux transporter family protein n=1 Tax=Brevibacillus laterosporus TaxID=1465 RepID=UPI001F0975BE|nr:multidrug resistance efflux transporter family protein [Brevibacillus laterosporus]